MIAQLPTEEEINVHDSLDERDAVKHFLGKSLAEAEELFRANAMFYQEDLMWMGPIAFQYYVGAAIRYIESEAATGDSDMVNCFAGLLEFRLAHYGEHLVSVAQRLAAACTYVVEHWERFDVAQQIYGDLPSRYRTLRGQLSALAENGGGAA